MKDKLTTDPDFAAMRQQTLAQLEKTERAKRWALIVVAILEVVTVVAFVLLADFSNRTHLLIFISMLGVWLLLGMGLVVLGILQRENMFRILNAIQSLRD